MKHIIGLGNPGKQYQANRHNVGFMVVDEIMQNAKCKMQNCNLQSKINKRFNSEIYRINEAILVKPQTFMNRSGAAVARLRQFYKVKPKDIWVIHDDLDLRIGQYKIQFGRGPKDHHGLQSIEQHLKTKDFWRVRVGVDNRFQERIDGETYVLQNFTKAERELLQPAISSIITDLKQSIINGG